MHEKKYSVNLNSTTYVVSASAHKVANRRLQLLRWGLFFTLIVALPSAITPVYAQLALAALVTQHRHAQDVMCFQIGISSDERAVEARYAGAGECLQDRSHR